MYIRRSSFAPPKLVRVFLVHWARFGGQNSSLDHHHRNLLDCFFRTAEERSIHIQETCRVDERLCSIAFRFVKEICRTNGNQACRGQILSQFQHDAAVSLGGDDMGEITAPEKLALDGKGEMYATIQPD